MNSKTMPRPAKKKVNLDQLKKAAFKSHSLMGLWVSAVRVILKGGEI